jgi:hypothetical protein
MRSRWVVVLSALHGLLSLTACRSGSHGDQAASVRPADDPKQRARAGTPAVAAQVYVSADRGTTWQPAAAGLPAVLSITDLTAGDSQLALATKRDGIFLFAVTTDRWYATPTVPPADVDAIAVHGSKLFAGTHGSGVWLSADTGKTWLPHIEGLTNLTVRKLVVRASDLYAATNGGLFKLDAVNELWSRVYGDEDMQVNGLAAEAGRLYLGTQRGVQRFDPKAGWSARLADRSLHNIAVAGQSIYAMAYDELYVSNDHGDSWRSSQAGMPAGKYTFQIQDTGETLLAGQWDGVYRLTSRGWQRSARGLPRQLAVTEMVTWRDRIVIASSTLPLASATP